MNGHFDPKDVALAAQKATDFYLEQYEQARERCIARYMQKTRFWFGIGPKLTREQAIEQMQYDWVWFKESRWAELSSEIASRAEACRMQVIVLDDREIRMIQNFLDCSE